MFLIRMGVPEMISFWDELCKKVKSGKSNADDRKLYKKMGKALYMLSENPRHPGLESHEISSLSNRYGDSGCSVSCKNSIFVRKMQSHFFKAVLLNHLLSKKRDSLLRT